MSAIIRQQYVDPLRGNHSVRDINIDIENVRPNNSPNASTKFYLKAEAWGHDQVHTVYVDPDELVSWLIDGKRTSAPSSCRRTYLVKPFEDDDHIEVHDAGPKGLDANIGDPIAFLNNLDGAPPEYSLITKATGNTIHIASRPKCKYFKGAFIENLADRWHRQTVLLGAKSQLQRPQAVPFIAKSSGQKINVLISTPMNLATIVAYDFYARKEPFVQIKPHWIPDKQDIGAKQEEFCVETFGGGKPAGGDLLAAGTYYVALISKDNLGRVNVNESECFYQEVQIQ